MQNFVALGVAAVLALTAGDALAMGSGKFKGVALLAQPTAAPVKTRVAGVTWRCEGAVCVGSGPAYSGLDRLLKECGQLSAAVGPLAGFKSRGRVVRGDRLQVCNRLAAREATGTQMAEAR